MSKRVDLPAALVSSARAGDPVAAEKLGSAILQLAEAAAWRTGARGADLEDLRQAGALAALEALTGRSWDPKKGDPASYAYRAAARAISRNSQQLRAAVTYGRAQQPAELALHRGRREPGGTTTVEIARRSGRTQDEMGYLLAPVVSLDALPARDSLEAATRESYPGAIQEDPPCTMDEIVRMGFLTPRQERVLDLRYGITGPAHSLREIAEILEIPKSRVWRTIRSATSRLSRLVSEGVQGADGSRAA
jgi:DNA-directed RNA polymerase sigma subunit (sigma70/sigma32)